MQHVLHIKKSFEKMLGFFSVYALLVISLHEGILEQLRKKFQHIQISETESTVHSYIQYCAALRFAI